MNIFFMVFYLLFVVNVYYLSLGGYYIAINLPIFIVCLCCVIMFSIYSIVEYFKDDKLLLMINSVGVLIVMVTFFMNNRLYRRFFYVYNSGLV
ncbi:hypothetical protein C0W54_12820 [Photobacterium kishitanii]|nr:hypothetical protein C0W54_12820 [Photobacterium kishitanii]